MLVVLRSSILSAVSLIACICSGAENAPPQPPCCTVQGAAASTEELSVFCTPNLVAWCIVPFDAKRRGPAQRAEMLSRLGIKKLAYDWRAEHIPTFDEEVEAMKRRGIELTAWWFPGGLDAAAKTILDVIERQKITPQLWITGGGAHTSDAAEDARRVEAEAARLRPIAEAAQRLGCKVALYNHGGWFGEPENQVKIIARLAREGVQNLGIVYNFHHGHDHIARFTEMWPRMQPHVLAVNLNGMVRDGDKAGRKILHIGEGDQELAMMRVIHESGWRGPVGIIDHLDHTDSEETLTKNLRGLDRLRQELLAPADQGAAFPRGPLDPAARPLHTHPVNQHRLYDFYAKQALHALSQSAAPHWLPPFPGLDGGKFGHWGAQNEDAWRDARWNEMDLGSMHSGVFLGWGKTVTRAVCVRLGETGEMSACFDPDRLTWVAAWKGGFLRFSPVRYGFLGGCEPAGEQIELAADEPAPRGSFTYHGFFRSGPRVVFHYTRDGVEWLDTAWCEDGRFIRSRAPADDAALAALAKSEAPQWRQVLESRGTLGDGAPYAIDTIEFPSSTPWRSLWHIGDHDFFPNGDAALCTIEGEVWLVRGLNDSLEKVRWKRFAAGLHQPLGLKIRDGKIHVLGRDQITRLHDLNGDYEADRYECFSNAYASSAAGHDYITGLQQDREGRFLFASSNQGICRASTDGRCVEVLATGFRNPNGLGLSSRGEIIAAAQEGEWTPASMLMQVEPGGHYGYGGPRPGESGRLPPLVYLPRGVDHSCGGQVFVESERWGAPAGTLVHLSFGAGSAFLIVRDAAHPAQGGVAPLPGDFRSGAHRGRFHPLDGQLYVTGLAGWVTYGPDDGCFQRVRYTGGAVRAPLSFEARENGVLLTFAEPLTADAAGPRAWFAQAWNYRYGPAYGSDEFSLRHPHKPGHDVLEITSAHLNADRRQLFLEIPQLHPAHTVHLHAAKTPLLSRDLFLTVHRLGPPFTDFPGYRAIAKTSLPQSTGAAPANQPLRVLWESGEPGRQLRIQATTGLQFAQRELHARAGERLSLILDNPDVMPHNWVLGARGAVEQITDAANKLITDPGAAARHYVPELPEILCHTRVVEPASSTTIHFDAPAEAGEYPYLCTFPGHAAVMRGVLRVE